MSYTYLSLNSLVDDLEFSNDNGTSWTYLPTPVDGYDSTVTDIRVVPQGQFDGSDGVNHPSLEVWLKMRIE